MFDLLVKSMTDFQRYAVKSSSRPDYLCVDLFLRDLVGARALQSAFELGLVDHLLRNPASDSVSMENRFRLDTQALLLLLLLLRANAVVDERDGRYSLSSGFRKALKFRDLLEAKLEFAALVVPDFLERFSTLLTDPERFFEQSRTFDLFSYDRCFDPSPENMASTRRWMRFTTALTKYEAQSCIDHHDFSAYRRLLDVGGNSGEFALRLCRAFPQLRASILDLPLVCDVGTGHLHDEPEANRIDFIKVAGERASFPEDFDIVCFKSMLHDWPEEAMHEFLVSAYASLKRGGSLLIFERTVLAPETGQIPYSQIPIMLFFRSYRIPDTYAAHLARIGFDDIRIQFVELETLFMLVTAIK